MCHVPLITIKIIFLIKSQRDFSSNLFGANLNLESMEKKTYLSQIQVKNSLFLTN